MGASVCLIRPIPDREHLNQWDYVLTNFPPDDLFVIGDLGGYASKVVGRATRLGSAADLPSRDLVLVAPIGGTHVHGDRSLVDFKHPRDAVYLFGPDTGSLEDRDLCHRRIRYKVFVPTASNTEMYSFLTAGIVMYDRLVKRG